MQEITAAIDVRLAEVRAEIASLEAARRALTSIQRSRPGPRTQSRSAAARPTPAKPRRARAAAPRRAAATTSTATPASAPAEQPAEVTPPVKPARRRRSQAPAAAPTPPTPAPSPAEAAPKARATRSRAARSAAGTAPKARPAKASPRSRRRELEPGEIEGLLRDSDDGLSLVALARRSGVSESKVGDRLRTLERSGEVRSSGPRRTSLWRLVTDEERIAERAAELARASQTTSSRRRASS
jgi:hypothetical protein